MFLSLFAVASVVASCNSGGGGSSSPGGKSGGSADTHTVGNYTVKLVDKTLTIIGYDGSSDVVLPESLKVNDVDYPITVIGDSAFKDKGLTSVTFFDSSSDSTNDLETIGKSAFADNDLTVDITIPASVVTIGESAFAGNHLTDVSFDSSSDNPSDLETIGKSAFEGNDLTADITIPASVKTIGESAFAGNHLTDISFDSASNLETIGASAFANNDLTADITIPASVKTIGESAFQGNKLSKVEFAQGGKLTFIGASAFAGNDGLSSLTLPFSGDNHEWHASDAKVTDSDGILTNGIQVTDFTVAYSLELTSTDASYFIFKESTRTIIGYSDDGPKDVTIPFRIGGYGVTAIGDNAFEDKRLTSVTIPVSVTTIGDNAFRNNLLARVTFAANSQLTSVGTNAFADNPADLTVTLPTPAANMVWNPFATIGQNGGDFSVDYKQEMLFAFNAGNGAITGYSDAGPKDVVIPATINRVAVTTIGDNAFEDKGLTSVIIPDSVITIGENAFQDNSIDSVTIPSSVITIEANAFHNNLLASVTIPSSVITIKANTFRNNLLDSVTIPSSVITIEANAFRNNLLASVPFAANSQLTSVGTNAFADNPADLTVELPTPAANMVWNPSETIGGEDGGHFDENYNLVNSNFPDFVFNPDTATITNYLGNGGNVTIPETIGGVAVTTIGNNAFEAKRLTQVTIQASVTSIGESAFQNNQLTSVDFTGATSLTSIGGKAFKDNTIDSVAIPPSLQTIGQETFMNNSFTSVDFSNAGSLTTIGRDSFKGRDHSIDVVDFSGATSLTNIAGPYIFVDSRIGTIIFGSNVTTIGNEAFRSSGIANVDFTGATSLTSIGDKAFKDNAIDSVAIPSSLQTIGQETFMNNSFTSVDFSNAGSLTTIGRDSFKGREHSIDVVDFSGATSLTNIVGPYIFVDSRIGTIIFGSNVTTIGASAFRSTGSIANVDFTGATSLASIGISAFLGSNIARVTFAANSKLTSVGSYAFGNNSGLSSVTLPAATEDKKWRPNAIIGRGGGGFDATYMLETIFAFNADNGTITGYSNAGTKDVVIPATIGGVAVTVIGDNAFKNKGLTSVTIPAVVRTIGNNAFRDNNLGSVTFSANSLLTSVGANAFAGNSDLSSVTLPPVTSYWSPSSTIGSGSNSGFGEAYTYTVPDSAKEDVGYPARWSTNGVQDGGYVLLMADTLSAASGQLKSISAYFRNTNPVTFQVWRHVSGNDYKLISEFDHTPSAPGIETIPVLGSRCFAMQKGDRIGMKITIAPSSVVYTLSFSQPSTFQHQFTSPPEIGDTIQFPSVPQSTKFHVEANVEQGRRCP